MALASYRAEILMKIYKLAIFRKIIYLFAEQKST